FTVLVFALELASVAAGIEPDAFALALLPLVNLVARDVGKEQILAVLDPGRPLSPDVAFDDFFNLGLLGDQFIQAGIEAFDFSQRGILFLAARFGRGQGGRQRQRRQDDQNGQKECAFHGVIPVRVKSVFAETIIVWYMPDC